jgi:HNH endonuclease
MRSHIEDVSDVLREIRSVDSEGMAGRSVRDVRLRAVQTVAKAELAKGRYKNWDSAEKPIHEACTRRLQKNLSVKGFDVLVKNWLSGQPEGLQSLLKRAHGYGKNMVEVEALLHVLVPGEHSVVPDGEGTSYSASAVLKANDIVDVVHPERRETIVQRIIRDTETARALKLRYQNQCQICGFAVPLWDGLTYAEAHHIRPLGHPHNGPDSPSNMIILCPNHHAQCDLGALKLDIESLRRLPDHVIDTEHVQYHNTIIAK